MIEQILSRSTLKRSAKLLAAEHPELALVLEKYGPPPLWDREPGFATLLHIILEQQVSLASARACFDRLRARVGHVSPESLLSLEDVELRAAGFSRQKAGYAKQLSESAIAGRVDLDSLHLLSDDEVRSELTKVKGIGAWTSDIYLLMALLRPDVMPRGDIALHEAYRRLAGLDKRPGADEFLSIAERWKPYRSVAARLLWHFYLSEKAR